MWLTLILEGDRLVVGARRPRHWLTGRHLVGSGCQAQLKDSAPGAPWLHAAWLAFGTAHGWPFRMSPSPSSSMAPSLRGRRRVCDDDAYERLQPREHNTPALNPVVNVAIMTAGKNVMNAHDIGINGDPQHGCNPGAQESEGVGSNGSGRRAGTSM
jgi:hypothetical protein